jgi:hypothetical protein
VMVEPKKASAEPAWQISGFFISLGSQSGPDLIRSIVEGLPFLPIVSATYAVINLASLILCNNWTLAIDTIVKSQHFRVAEN